MLVYDHNYKGRKLMPLLKSTPIIHSHKALKSNSAVDGRHKSSAKGDTIMVFSSQVSTEMKLQSKVYRPTPGFCDSIWCRSSTEENCSFDTLLGSGGKCSRKNG